MQRDSILASFLSVQFPRAGLTQFFLVALLVISMVRSAGAFGFGGSGFAGGTMPTNCRNCSVFNAGPSSTISLGLANTQSSHLNWPPAYVMTATSTEQPLQLIPSSCCTPFPERNPTLLMFSQTLGTIGIAGGEETADPPNFDFNSPRMALYGEETPWAKERCTIVDVWMNSSVEIDPTAKDKATAAYLRIRPPARQSNCTKWVYHSNPVVVERDVKIVSPPQPINKGTDATK